MSANFFKIRNGANIVPQASAPSSPENGDIYYDSTLNEFRFYQNGTWESVSGAAFPLQAPNGSASTPQYSFANKTTSGMYLDDATTGALGFTVAGTELVQMLPSQVNLLVSAANTFPFSIYNPSDFTGSSGVSNFIGGFINGGFAWGVGMYDGSGVYDQDVYLQAGTSSVNGNNNRGIRFFTLDAGSRAEAGRFLPNKDLLLNTRLLVTDSAIIGASSGTNGATNLDLVGQGNPTWGNLYLNYGVSDFTGSSNTGVYISAGANGGQHLWSIGAYDAAAPYDGNIFFNAEPGTINGSNSRGFMWQTSNAGSRNPQMFLSPTGVLSLMNAGSASVPSFIIGDGTVPANTGFWANSGGVGFSVGGTVYYAAGSSIFELGAVDVTWATDGAGNIGTAIHGADHGRPANVYVKSSVVVGDDSSGDQGLVNIGTGSGAGTVQFGTSTNWGSISSGGGQFSLDILGSTFIGVDGAAIKFGARNLIGLTSDLTFGVGTTRFGYTGAGLGRPYQAALGSLALAHPNNGGTLLVRGKADIGTYSSGSGGGPTTAVNASTTLIMTPGAQFVQDLAVGDRVAVSSAPSTYAYVTGITGSDEITLSTALGDGTAQTLSVKHSIMRIEDQNGTAMMFMDDLGNLSVTTPLTSFSNAINLAEIATPGTNPASGTHDLYFKSDGFLYTLNSSGTEVKLGGSFVGGPGSSTDTAIATWNGTSGTLLNNTGVTIDASDNIATTGSVTTGQVLAATNTVAKPGLSFSSYPQLGFVGAGNAVSFCTGSAYYWYSDNTNIVFGAPTGTYNMFWNQDGGGDIGSATPGSFTGRPNNVYVKSQIVGGTGSSSAPELSFITNQGMGWHANNSGTMAFAFQGALPMYINSNQMGMGDGTNPYYLFWSADGVGDIGALTYTSFNGKPGNIYAKTSLNVGTQSGTGGILTMYGTSGANFTWDTDGAGDIGAHNAHRPNNAYFKGGMSIGTNTYTAQGGLLNVGNDETVTPVVTLGGGAGHYASKNAFLIWLDSTNLSTLDYGFGKDLGDASLTFSQYDGNNGAVHQMFILDNALGGQNFNLLWGADGNGNLGAASASRPNNIYVKTGINVGTNTGVSPAGSISLGALSGHTGSYIQIGTCNYTNSDLSMVFEDGTDAWMWSHVTGTTQVQFGHAPNGTGVFTSALTLDTVGGTGLVNLAVNGQIYSPLNTVSTPAGTTQTIDWNNGGSQEIDLTSATGDVTVTFTNVNSGSNLDLFIIQGSTPRNIIFTGVKWPSGIAPTISIGSGAIDLASFKVRGSTVYGTIEQNFS